MNSQEQGNVIELDDITSVEIHPDHLIVSVTGFEDFTLSGIPAVLRRGLYESGGYVTGVIQQNAQQFFFVGVPGCGPSWDVNVHQEVYKDQSGDFIPGDNDLEVYLLNCS